MRDTNYLSIGFRLLSLAAFLSACGGAGGGLVASGVLGAEGGETKFIDEPIDIPVTPAKDTVFAMALSKFVTEKKDDHLLVEGLKGAIWSGQYDYILIVNETNGEMADPEDVVYEDLTCKKESVTGCLGAFEQVQLPMDSDQDLIRFEPHFMNGEIGLAVFLRFENNRAVWSLDREGQNVLYRELPSADDREPFNPPTRVIPTIETPTIEDTIQPLPGRTTFPPEMFDPAVNLGPDVIILPPAGNSSPALIPRSQPDLRNSSVPSIRPLRR